MKLKRSVLLAIIIVVVIAVSSVAYITYQNAEQRRMRAQQIEAWRKTLIIASISENVYFDPAKLTNLPAATILRQTYEGLVDYKGDTTEVTGLLATSWDISSDGTVYTFHLRNGVKFQDGTSFNATAAKFAFDRYVGVKKGLYYGSLSRIIDRVDAVDPLTLRITLKTSYGPFLSMLATLYMKIFISPTAINKNKTPDDPWAEKWADSHIVGTGPYTLASYVPGGDVTLGSFSDYWGGWTDKNFNRVVFRLVREASSQKQLLMAGDVDVAENIIHEDYPALNQTAGVMITVDTIHPSAKILLPMFTARPPLNDVRVRQAILYALDVGAINNAVYEGTAVRMHGPFTPGVFPGLGSPAPYINDYSPRDLAKAKALMQAAGYSMDKPVKMAATTLNTPDNLRFFQVVQSQLKDIGIDVDVQAVTVPERIARANDPKRMTEFYSYEGPTWYGDPDEIYINLHSSAFNPAGWNVVRYNNSKVDQLLDQARTLTNYNDRVKLYQQIEQIVTQDAPWGFVLAEGNYYVYAHRTSLKGRILNPINVRTLNIYGMWKEGLPPGQQSYSVDWNLFNVQSMASMVSFTYSVPSIPKNLIATTPKA